MRRGRVDPALARDAVRLGNRTPALSNRGISYSKAPHAIIGVRCYSNQAKRPPKHHGHQARGLGAKPPGPARTHALLCHARAVLQKTPQGETGAGMARNPAEPGTLIWTAPHGRSYTVQPGKYPV